ncbi:hypothetical protein ID866_7654 [Astraeus odoratus]|nr:hypothetical protein ID866_7654 [Astraeus odoratus]
MRLSGVVLALSMAVTSVHAGISARQSLPSCAATCIANADYGDCAQDDDSCLCHNQSFIDSATTCIESSCQGNDLTEAEQFAQALCAAVGVTLTETVPASTSTSPASASTSASATTSASTSATPSSGASLSYGINIFAGAAAVVALGAAL